MVDKVEMLKETSKCILIISFSLSPLFFFDFIFFSIFLLTHILISSRFHPLLTYTHTYTLTCMITTTFLHDVEYFFYYKSYGLNDACDWVMHQIYVYSYSISIKSDICDECNVMHICTTIYSVFFSYEYIEFLAC